MFQLIQQKESPDIAKLTDIISNVIEMYTGKMSATAALKGQSVEQREIQILESQLSFQKAKYMQLQNKIKEQEEDLERKENNFKYQKKQLIEKATQQQTQIILKLQKDLKDKSDVLGLFMRKVAERDNAIKQLNDQIEKIKSAKLKKKKALKKRKSPMQMTLEEEASSDRHPEGIIPQHLNKISELAITPYTNDFAASDGEEYNELMQCSKFLDLPKLDQNAAEQEIELQDEELTKPMFCLTILDAISKEQMVSLLEKTMRMPIQCLAECSEDQSPFTLKFFVNSTRFLCYQRLKEQMINCDAGCNQFKIISAQPPSEGQI